MSISATFYKWKAKYGGLEVSDAKLSLNLTSQPYRKRLSPIIWERRADRSFVIH
jgi:hypothetical protein